MIDFDKSLLLQVDNCWRPTVLQMLGCTSEELKCQVSIVYSKPGAPYQDWHSDGAHVQSEAGWGFEINNDKTLIGDEKDKSKHYQIKQIPFYCLQTQGFVCVLLSYYFLSKQQVRFEC